MVEAASCRFFHEGHGLAKFLKFKLLTVAKKTHSEGIGNANAFVKRRHSIAMYCHFTQDRIMISMPFIIQCITQQIEGITNLFLF